MLQSQRELKQFNEREARLQAKLRQAEKVYSKRILSRNY